MLPRHSQLWIDTYVFCRTYKRVMEEAAMLGSFIRLVDYLMIEALVDRTVGTVEELVAMLEAPRQGADKSHKVCCLFVVYTATCKATES